MRFHLELSTLVTIALFTIQGRERVSCARISCAPAFPPPAAIARLQVQVTPAGSKATPSQYTHLRLFHFNKLNSIPNPILYIPANNMISTKVSVVSGKFLIK